jgi:MerR family copper efflux transcriptional regulator
MLTRGELAKQSGVNRETVRYYERSGLLPEPQLNESGYWLFTQAAAERIRFIKRAQAVGFSLEQIRALLDLQITPASTCGDVRGMVESRIAEVDEKIRQLTAMRDSLVELLAECPGGERPLEECPVLESFASEDALVLPA